LHRYERETVLVTSKLHSAEAPAAASATERDDAKRREIAESVVMRYR
jgi:hypothetical protein